MYGKISHSRGVNGSTNSVPNSPSSHALSLATSNSRAMNRSGGLRRVSTAATPKLRARCARAESPALSNIMTGTPGNRALTPRNTVRRPTPRSISATMTSVRRRLTAKPADGWEEATTPERSPSPIDCGTASGTDTCVTLHPSGKSRTSCASNTMRMRGSRRRALTNGERDKRCGISKPTPTNIVPVTPPAQCSPGAIGRHPWLSHLFSISGGIFLPLFLMRFRKGVISSRH